MNAKRECIISNCGWMVKFGAQYWKAPHTVAMLVFAKSRRAEVTLAGRARHSRGPWANLCAGPGGCALIRRVPGPSAASAAPREPQERPQPQRGSLRTRARAVCVALLALQWHRSKPRYSAFSTCAGIRRVSPAYEEVVFVAFPLSLLGRVFRMLQ